MDTECRKPHGTQQSLKSQTDALKPLMRSLIALALDEAEASDPSTLSVSRHGKMTVIDLEDFGQLTIVCEAGRLYAVAIPDVKPMLMPIGSLAKRLHRLLDKLDSEKD